MLKNLWVLTYSDTISQSNNIIQTIETNSKLTDTGTLAEGHEWTEGGAYGLRAVGQCEPPPQSQSTLLVHNPGSHTQTKRDTQSECKVNHSIKMGFCHYHHSPSFPNYMIKEVFKSIVTIIFNSLIMVTSNQII